MVDNLWLALRDILIALWPHHEVLKDQCNDMTIS